MAFRAPEGILVPGSGRRNFGAAASAMAVWPRAHGTKASPAEGCGEEQRRQAAANHGRGWCQLDLGMPGNCFHDAGLGIDPQWGRGRLNFEWRI